MAQPSAAHFRSASVPKPLSHPIRLRCQPIGYYSPTRNYVIAMQCIRRLARSNAFRLLSNMSTNITFLFIMDICMSMYLHSNWDCICFAACVWVACERKLPHPAASSSNARRTLLRNTNLFRRTLNDIRVSPTSFGAETFAYHPLFRESSRTRCVCAACTVRIMLSHSQLLVPAIYRFRSKSQWRFLLAQIIRRALSRPIDLPSRCDPSVVWTKAFSMLAQRFGHDGICTLQMPRHILYEAELLQSGPPFQPCLQPCSLSSSCRLILSSHTWSRLQQTEKNKIKIKRCSASRLWPGLIQHTNFAFNMQSFYSLHILCCSWFGSFLPIFGFICQITIIRALFWMCPLWLWPDCVRQRRMGLCEPKKTLNEQHRRNEHKASPQQFYAKRT